MILFPSANFVLVVVVFPIVLGIKFGCLFDIFSSFLRQDYTATNFSLRTAFAATHRF